MTKMALTLAMKEFIAIWGEVGPNWGISRSVAQIHALLYLAHEPLTARTIADTLSIARSNVSGGLGELDAFGLVRTTHRPGDRKDYYEIGEREPWAMLRLIVAERKRREFDPMRQRLRTLAEEVEQADGGLHPRVKELADCADAIDALYHALSKVPTALLARFASLGERAAAAVGSLGSG